MTSSVGWFALVAACAVLIAALFHDSRSPSGVGEVGGPPDSDRQTALTSQDGDRADSDTDNVGERWRHQANDVEVDRQPVAYSFVDLGGESSWQIHNSNGSKQRSYLRHVAHWYLVK
jgi:hypothetical protein